MRKKIFYLLILLIGIFYINDSASALDNKYGIYCSYGDYYFLFSGSHKDNFFNLDTNFDELGIAIEVGRPGKGFSDPSEQEWFKNKGLIDSDGNFACPDNPFGSSLGSADYKECGEEGCKVAEVESRYETYTCNYVAPSTGNVLRISYTSNEDYKNGKWDIVYPDGTSAILVGTQINGNFMPGSDCEDIYYTKKDKRIKVAIDANENVTNNATLSGLCDSYKQSEIEHFCSGKCSFKDGMLCQNGSYGDESGTCPSELVPVMKFVKLVLKPIVQIAIPIILILMGSIDLGRAVVSSDDKAIKEAGARFLRRCIAAIIVFFVVTIVNALMNMIATVDDMEVPVDWKSCWNIDKNQ